MSFSWVTPLWFSALQFIQCTPDVSEGVCRCCESFGTGRAGADDQGSRDKVRHGHTDRHTLYGVQHCPVLRVE